MRGAFGPDPVDYDGCIKFLFNPTPCFIEILVKPLGNIRFVPTAFDYVALAEAELRQNGAEISPFGRKVGLQDSGSMAPFVNLEMVLNCLGQGCDGHILTLGEGEGALRGYFLLWANIRGQTESTCHR